MIRLDLIRSPRRGEKPLETVTTSHPQSVRRWLTLIALLAVGALAIAFLRRSSQAAVAVPRVNEITRLHVYIELALGAAGDQPPPAFDAPPGHYAAIVERLNTATSIRRPGTALNVGRVEAWYREGESVRVDLFLIASADMGLATKDLVLATADGVWRRDGKYVDFVADVQKAYLDYKAEAH